MTRALRGAAGRSLAALCLAVFAAMLVCRSGYGIELPEVRSNGSVGYQFRTDRTGGERRNFRHTLNGTLNLDSYVWQPWFLTTRGGMQVSRITSSGAANTANSTVAGNVNLGFLPLSNFPVTLDYTRTDNRSDFDGESNTAVADSLNVLSRVFWDETLDFETGVGLQSATRNDGSDSSALRFRFGVDKKFDTNLVNVRFTHSSREDAGTTGVEGGEGSSNTLSVRHRYTPWENVTYDSTSNAILNDDSTDSESRQRTLLQATSTLRWIPVEYPLTVTALWRTLNEDTTQSFASSSTAGQTRNAQRSFNGRVGANYRFSPQLTADAALTGSYRTVEIEVANADEPSDVPSALGYGGETGVNYTGLQRKVMGFDWSWNTAGRLTADGGGGEGTVLDETVSAGHSVTRVFNVPWLRQLNFSAGETLRVGHNSTDGLSPALGHNMRLNHNWREGNQWTASSFSISDNRTLAGANPQSSQLVNFQLSHNLRTDPLTTWRGHLTMQSSRQTSGSASSGGEWNNFAQASLRYLTRNIFGVSNLDFTSELVFESRSLLPVAFSSSADPRSEVAWKREWTSRLGYSIGKVRLELSGRLSQEETGDVSDSLMFRVLRAF